MNELNLINVNDYITSYNKPTSEHNSFKFYYISDIHIEHLLDEKNDYKQQIKKIIKRMFTREIICDFFKYNSEYKNLPIILLGGDIVLQKKLSAIFIKHFKDNICTIFINKQK